MDDESEWPLRDRIAYVPVDVEHKWARLAFSAGDRARLRDRVRRAMDELDPVAMLLWNGTEFVSFELPTPGVVVDRIDCIGLMAWRSRLETTNPVEKLRAVRKAYRFARYEREVVRSADVTVVVSDDDAAALRRVSGSPDVRVIPNGVTLQPRDGNQEQAGQPTVIFTGVLSYRPNIEAAAFFAQRVWPSVRESVSDARFVIAGRRPSSDIVALATDPGIEVIGDVRDMPALLREAWVAVAPMRSGTGIKNKVLEAWSASRPVVMTELAASGLQLDSTARELVVDSPDKMAAAVSALLTEPERRRRAGMAGYQLAERQYSWSDAVSEFDSVLKHVAGVPQPLAS
jgi:glycosyltransferase involved in cell wall biosynthesis